MRHRDQINLGYNVSICLEALRFTTKLQSGKTISMPETEAETFRIQDGSDIR